MYNLCRAREQEQTNARNGTWTVEYRYYIQFDARAAYTSLTSNQLPSTCLVIFAIFWLLSHCKIELEPKASRQTHFCTSNPINRSTTNRERLASEAHKVNTIEWQSLSFARFEIIAVNQEMQHSALSCHNFIYPTDFLHWSPITLAAWRVALRHDHKNCAETTSVEINMY